MKGITFNNLSNYGIDVRPQWDVVFVVFMSLGASSRLRAKTERTATRGPRNPARLTNSFNFVHETRSLRFPFACESENVLEENVGPDRGLVMDVHRSGFHFTETGAVRRWPPPCWRSGPVLGCFVDRV